MPEKVLLIRETKKFSYITLHGSKQGNEILDSRWTNQLAVYRNNRTILLSYFFHEVLTEPVGDNSFQLDINLGN